MQRLSAGSSGIDTIVLLHGMGTGASAWEPQIEVFSAKHRVVAPYLPGYGPNPGPFSMAATREQVASLIKEVSSNPVHLCGLSLGALVALELTRENPELVRSLVLSAGFVGLPAEHVAQMKSTADSIRGYDPEAFEQDVLPGLVAGVPESHRSVALREISSLKPADLAEILSYEFDARAWIGEIDVPALVICGANDEPNLPLSRELAAELPDAKLLVIEGAGHVANLDTPNDFSEAVLEFVEGRGDS